MFGKNCLPFIDIASSYERSSLSPWKLKGFPAVSADHLPEGRESTSPCVGRHDRHDCMLMLLKFAPPELVQQRAMPLKCHCTCADLIWCEAKLTLRWAKLRVHVLTRKMDTHSFISRMATEFPKPLLYFVAYIHTVFSWANEGSSARGHGDLFVQLKAFSLIKTLLSV